MRSKKLPLYVAAGAGASALAALVGLSVSGSGSGAGAVTAAPKSTVVQTRATSIGRIIVDVQGRTLYLFAKDTGPTSRCIGRCAADWPPVPVTGAPQAADGASATALGVVARADGTRQLTYGGHPLYYFAGDKSPGQLNGQGIDEFGAKWYALSSAGAAVHRSADRAGNTANSGGGYGY